MKYFVFLIIPLLLCCDIKHSNSILNESMTENNPVLQTLIKNYNNQDSINKLLLNLNINFVGFDKVLRSESFPQDLKELIYNFIYCYRNDKTYSAIINFKEIEKHEMLNYLKFRKPQLKNFNKKQIYLKYFILNEKEYKLIWGNENIERVSSDTFNILGDGVLQVDTVDNSYIIVGQSCGTDCHLSLLLPYNNSQNLQRYYNIQYINMEKDVLICESNKPNVFLTVHNLKTLNSFDIKISWDSKYFPHNLIKSIEIKNEKLYIFWYTGHWDAKQGRFSQTRNKEWNINELFN